MFELIRQDLTRACRANQGQQVGFVPMVREIWNPGTQAILVYRFGYWSDNLRFRPARAVLRVLHFILQYFFAWRVGIFIPIKAKIGPGFVIHTWGGGIFLPSTTIGRNLTIIGGGIQLDYDTLGIGDEVALAPGTKGVGKIRIGNRVRTGPNSVILEDIPDDCVVFATPGRVMGPIRRGPASNSAASGAEAAQHPPAPPGPPIELAI